MIRIALESDSGSSLELGLGFSNTRGREDNEKTAAVARGEEDGGALDLSGKRED